MTRLDLEGTQVSRRVAECRCCGGRRLETVAQLGPQPLANSFVRADHLGRRELTVPLDLLLCLDCGLALLGDVVSPDVMFREYVYRSSTSPAFRAHFQVFAAECWRRLAPPPGALVVDIGSNDGILLRPFQALGATVLGIDPAENIAAAANAAGIETWPRFFGPEVATEIVHRRGRAHIITATNVFAHIDALDPLLEAVAAVLHPDGAFVIEVPYLADLVDKQLFDTIYHEHLSYFSVRSLVRLFARSRLEPFDVRRVDVHGGSLRMSFQHRGGQHAVTASLEESLEREERAGLARAETLRALFDRVRANQETLLAMLRRLRDEGRSIVGYGAPAKANTMLNLFGIGPDLLRYIVDDSPLKQGLFTPGTRIPVVPASRLESEPPDVVLILAWNFAPQILAKLEGLRARGVGCIVPVPTPTLIPSTKQVDRT